MPCFLFFWVGLVSLLWFELLLSHFGVLNIDCYCICHLFLIGWSPCSSRCNNTCWVWHFHVLDDIMKCLSHVTLMCPFLCSTLWKLNGSILLPIVGFFSGLLTWAGVASLLIDIISDIAQTCLCSCASLGVGIWLLTCPTTLTFCLSLAHF